MASKTKPPPKKKRSSKRKTNAEKNLAKNGGGALWQRGVKIRDGMKWAVAHMRELQGRPEYYEQLTKTLSAACPRIVAMMGSKEHGVAIDGVRALVDLERLRVQQETAHLTYAHGVHDGLAQVQITEVQAKACGGNPDEEDHLEDATKFVKSKVVTKA